jgi:hypothetical protein
MIKNAIPGKLFVVFAVLCAALAAPAAPRHIRPPTAHSYGHTLEEWAVLWCQWAYSFSEEYNPRTDTADCSLGQSGKVWFLADVLRAKPGIRQCVVPEGKALLFPIQFAFGFSTPEFPLTYEVLREHNSTYLGYDTNRICEVDGRPITDLERYHLQTSAFSVTLATDSDFDSVPGGTYEPAAADGYWVLLDPLPVGTHTIHIVKGAPGSDYYIDLLIQLTIVPATEYVWPNPVSD